jgi:hypothetical protein
MDQNYYLMLFDDGQLPMILVRANWPIGEKTFLEMMLKVHNGSKILRLIPGEVLMEADHG